MVARLAHNQEVEGSIPSPAIRAVMDNGYFEAQLVEHITTHDKVVGSIPTDAERHGRKAAPFPTSSLN